MSTEVGRVYLNGCNYQLRYDLLSQDTANNKSRVRLYGVLEVTNNYISWSRGTASVHTESGGIGTYYGKGTHTLIERDFEWGHDNNGDFSVYIGASLSTTFVSGSCGGTITLPHINRYAKTNSVIGTEVQSKKYDPEGTFKISFDKYISSYKYKLRVSIPNVTEIETVDYNTSGANYTLSNTAIAKLFEQDGTTGLPKYTPNNEFKLGFAVETWNNAGTSRLSSGNEIIVNCILQNANPTFSTITFNEASTSEGGLGNLLGSSANSVKVVKNYSVIKVTITSANKAVPQKGAKLIRYDVKSGNKTVSGDYSSSSNVNILLPEPDGDTLTVSAVDSRGNSTELLKDSTNGYTIIPYTPITQSSYAVTRDNNVSVSTSLTFTGTYSSSIGTLTNALQIKKYYYRKVGATTWSTGATTLNPTISGNNITISPIHIQGDVTSGFVQDSAYEVKLELADKIGNVKGNNYYFTSIVTLGSGSPAYAILGNCIALGMPYSPNDGGRIQVNKDVKVFDGTNFIPFFVDD